MIDNVSCRKFKTGEQLSLQSLLNLDFGAMILFRVHSAGRTATDLHMQRGITVN